MPKDFMYALERFQDLLDSDNPEALINDTQFKKAFVTICLLISESVRFDIVRYAVMNILNLYNESHCTYSLDYTTWAKWRPIIQNWSSLSNQLDEFGVRGLNPELLLGIPVHITDKRKHNALLSTFSFFAAPEQKVQEQVLIDFQTNFPFESNLDPGIHPMIQYSDTNPNMDALFAEVSIRNLMDKAKQETMQSKYRMALDYYLQAMDQFKKVQIMDKALILSLNFQTGFCYFKLDEYESAVEYLDCAHLFSALMHGETDKKTLQVEKLLDTCSEKIAENKERARNNFCN